jgi:hypothetical protein
MDFNVKLIQWQFMFLESFFFSPSPSKHKESDSQWACTVQWRLESSRHVLKAMATGFSPLISAVAENKTSKEQISISFDEKINKKNFFQP